MRPYAEIASFEIPVGHIQLPVLVYRDRGRSKKIFPPRYKAVTGGREFLGDSFPEVIQKVWHAFGLTRRGILEPEEEDLQWEAL